MSNKRNDCETIYLSYEQSIAMQQAMNDMAKEHGIQWDSIYVSPPIEDKGNWCDILPTQTKFILFLGVRMGMIMQQKNQ